MNRRTKTYKTITFVVYYIGKLVLANIYIAYDILTPKELSDPDMMWVPVKLKSKFGLLLFSNLISMTPGTLSIDYVEEKQALLVHYLYDKQSVIQQLTSMQNKIIEITG